jgi:hypothetical protein
MMILFSSETLMLQPVERTPQAQNWNPKIQEAQPPGHGFQFWISFLDIQGHIIISRYPSFNTFLMIVSDSAVHSCQAS